MGISNGVGTLSGMVCPLIVGAMTKHKVMICSVAVGYTIRVEARPKLEISVTFPRVEVCGLVLGTRDLVTYPGVYVCVTLSLKPEIS